MKKANIFVDMDGVLAVYHHDILSVMHDEKFFLDRPPIKGMIELVNVLIDRGRYNVYILSSVIDSPYCVPEKIQWLDKYLPGIKEKNRVFVPYGVVKAKFADEHVDINNRVNVLIDDYTDNLVNWTMPKGLPIKVLNGMNSTKGTWQDLKGHTIAHDDNVYKNADFIENLIKETQEG